MICANPECGKEIQPTGPQDHRRKWCSPRCRKTMYAGRCVDCGTPTSGGNGHRTEPRCLACANIRAGETRTVWTRQAILDAIRAWAAEHDGDPPATADWAPIQARRCGDPDRAARFEEAKGRWPFDQTVIRKFGSWNAGITAAGFEPREAGGNSANTQRKRKQRSLA